MQSALPPITVPANIGVKRAMASLGYGAELLMLGGASILLMLLSLIVSTCQFNTLDIVRVGMQHLAESVITFVALFSYPHFIWSYRFAYMQGKDFILKHSWELIFFPLILLGSLAVCIASWSIPVTHLPLVAAIECVFKSWGVDLQWSKYTSSGHLLFAWMFLLQFLMGGYHFAMQSFGVSLTCAEEKGYKLDPAQKNCLRNSLYALWAVNLFSGYSFLSILNDRCLGYRPIHFPVQMQMVALVALAFSFWLLYRRVLLPNRQRTGKWPPLTSMVTYAAIFTWFQPFYQPMAFSAWLAPVSHGLQYMYFSGRVEANNFDPRAAQLAKRAGLLRIFYLLLILVLIYCAGVFFFRFLPMQIDRRHFFADITPNFFFVATYVVLSTHHYLVDSVLWRVGSKVKELSYCQAPAA